MSTHFQEILKKLQSWINFWQFKDYKWDTNTSVCFFCFVVYTSSHKVQELIASKRQRWAPTQIFRNRSRWRDSSWNPGWQFPPHMTVEYSKLIQSPAPSSTLSTHNLSCFIFKPPAALPTPVLGLFWSRPHYMIWPINSSLSTSKKMRTLSSHNYSILITQKTVIPYVIKHTLINFYFPKSNPVHKLPSRIITIWTMFKFFILE